MSDINEQISIFLSASFPEIIFIEKYDSKFTSIKDGKILFVENVSNNRKNCYTSISSLKTSKLNGLELKVNESQPSNTLYIGNISFEGLLEYYCGESISFSIYENIIIGFDAYDEKGELFLDRLPVFVDIDFVKMDLDNNNKLLNCKFGDKDYLDFEALYTKLC